MMQRNLELTFRMDKERVEVDVYEPESGEVSQFEFPLSVDEHQEFDKKIGDDIYSWLALWMEDEDR